MNRIVYTPNDVSTLGHQYLEFKRDHKEASLPFPSTKFPEIYPMFPGEMMSVIARPGHAKTGLMMYWARQRSRWLKENKIKNRVAVYATWEQSIEELHSFYIAADQGLSITKMAKMDMSEEDWTKAMDASAKRISEPLWFIGHSVMRRTGRRLITVNELESALAEIQDSGTEIDSLYVDYLQRIEPSSSYESQAVAYSKTLDGIKNLALGIAVPVVVGVQASREVEQLSLPIPEIQHGQWTSNIEQSSDRVIALVRPRRYRKEGEKFGDKVVTGHRQLLISVLKQKLGEANFQRWVLFNPIYNRLDDNEAENGGVNE